MNNYILYHANASTAEHINKYLLQLPSNINTLFSIISFFWQNKNSSLMHASNQELHLTSCIWKRQMKQPTHAFKVVVYTNKQAWHNHVQIQKHSKKKPILILTLTHLKTQIIKLWWSNNWTHGLIYTNTYAFKVICVYKQTGNHIQIQKH